MLRSFRRFLKYRRRSARKRPNVAARDVRARYANWTVGAVAGLLVLISSGGYFCQRRQLDAIAAGHPRLIVAGPSRIQSGLAARYAIETTAIDGRPLPAEIEVVISNTDGEMIKAFKEKVGSGGRLTIAIPPDMELPPRVMLKVVAVRDGVSEQMESILPVHPDRFNSRLALDRAVYRPGDTVRFRMLTLSDFGLKEPPDGKITCKIARLAFDFAVSPLQHIVESRRGIAAGTFALPDDLPDGVYALSATGMASEGKYVASRKFQVVRRKPDSDAADADRTWATASRESETVAEAMAAAEAMLIPAEKVFAAGAPLKFNVRAIEAKRPLVAAAFFKDALVGQTRFLGAANERAGRDITLHIDDEIGGTIRVALFDFGGERPTLLAERCVYRQPLRTLKVQPADAAERYKPGEKVKLTLQATDETGQPVPAVMSASVEKLRQTHGRDETNQTEASPDRTPTKDFSPGDGGGARPPVDPALRDADIDAATDELEPPLIFDNGEKVWSNYANCLAEYQTQRTVFWDTLTATSFFGGMGLVVMVLMLGLMRIVSGLHLWVSAVGATTCCMILGAILTDPIETPSGGEPVATFTANVPQGDGPAKAAPAPFAPRAAAPIAETDRETTETVYWNPLLIAGADGTTAIEFELPPGDATYLLNVESHGEGRAGLDRMEIVAGGAPQVDPKTHPQ